MGAPPTRVEATVSAGAITRNVERLRRELRPATALCAVVKADGYGHGDALAARAALAGGATWLAVATAGEAVLLRAAGLAAPRLLVLGALTAEELAAAVAADADVVAWTPELLDAAGPGARVHVKLDSGMGRLGTRDAAAAAALAREAHRRGVLAGLMTHFATADDRADAFFDRQLHAFTAWVDGLADVRGPGVVVHAANSAALLREPAAHFDLVRPGVAIYGLDPFGEDAASAGLEPALRLTSWVAAVKALEPGESAGYGRRFVATAPTATATVPIGYGDGWRRGLTNNAEALVRGRRRPLVGTVSMDNVTLEVGRDGDVAVGDEVVLLGDGLTAEEVARRLGTINYEVTCALTARVPRREVP